MPFKPRQGRRVVGCEPTNANPPLGTRVLGFEIGVARAVGAVVFGIIVGLIMAVVFREDEQDRIDAAAAASDPPRARRSLWQTVLYFACMIAHLVFGDWYHPEDVVVHRTDGEDIAVQLLQETRDDVVLPVDRPVAGLKVGDKITLAKTGIDNMEEACNFRHGSRAVKLRSVR